MANSMNEYIKVVSIYVFLCYYINLSGSSDLACSSSGADIPCNSVCDHITSTYFETNKIHLNASVYMPRNSSSSSVATSCSCDIVINPAPTNITIKYRTSDSIGCRILYYGYNEPQDCMIQMIVFTEINSAILFSKRSWSKYLCFGIDFGNQYKDDNESTINVSCQPTEYTALSTEQTEDDLYMTTQLTSSIINANASISGMALTYSSNVTRKRFESNNTATHETTTGKFKETTNITVLNRTDDTFLNQATSSKWTVVGIACGGGVILSVASLLILFFCRFRRKRKCRQGHLEHCAAAQTLDAPDNELVVTDNLVYNLIDPQSEALSMFGIEAENATENDNVETDDLVYNMANVESKTEDKCYSKSENVKLVALSDKDKMELYANKSISKNTAMVKTNDLLYANACQP